MKKKLLILTLFSIVFASCSQFSNSITSKAWHNVNAKYNALWIAKVNYQFVSDTLFSIRNEDYTQVLPVFLPIDTLKNAVVADELNEVILKASRVAERHSNSKYLDEAYNLLGKARILKGDYINAAEVFKYVNSNGTNDFQKHAALISLMRVYIEQNDLQTANQVSDVIKALRLKSDNIADYYLTKAYYHQQNNEELLTAAILDEVLNLLPKGERKARIYYIAGQIYAKYKRSDLAEQRFLKVKKNKPNYDLSFNAQVNLLASRPNSRGAISEFAKMLEDRKNNDLRDKIFYKMGTLEVEQKNYRKAITYFQSSAAAAATKDGKARSYLALANLQYDQLANYEAAALYYDSTLNNLPPTDKSFRSITEKSNSLFDFIRYKKAIALEDSLQKLSRMNPLALDKKLEEIIKGENNEKQKMIELISSPAAASSAFTNAANRWELYDPIKLSRGKTTFLQKWGSRPLADNWRRREQQAGAIGLKLERLNEEQIKAEELAKQNPTNTPQNNEQLEAQKKIMLTKIPTDAQKFAASEMKQQEAMFQLGKIYSQKFNEPINASRTFQELLQRFPESPNAAETLYYLAIMADNPNDNSFKTTLLAKYPDSFFARKLARGNIEVSDDTESAAKRFYKELYTLYSAGNYETALASAERGLDRFTATEMEDKIAFLRIYILAKGNNVVLYQQALSDFILTFPNSKLIANVKSIQETINTKK